MLLGMTQVVFEGIPTYPDAGRAWAITDKYKVPFPTLPWIALLCLAPALPCPALHHFGCQCMHTCSVKEMEELLSTHASSMIHAWMQGTCLDTFRGALQPASRPFPAYLSRLYTLPVYLLHPLSCSKHARDVSAEQKAGRH